MRSPVIKRFFCQKLLRFMLPGLLLGLSVMPLTSSFAQEDNSDPVEDTLIVKTRDGLFFNLPEDWPIQKNGGTVGPVPVEQYLAMKFEKVNERITAIENRIAVLEEKNAEPKKEKARLISKESITDEQS